MKTHPKLERITPERAASFLNRNKGNRRLRPGMVEKYAHDMTNGLWTACSVPITFYEDGEVADGQHRLWAIVESGTTQQFFVLRNFPRDAGLNMDTGAPRSLVDNARLSGADTTLNHAIVAWARAVEEGDQQKSGNSYAERLAYVAKHRAAVEWVSTEGNLKGRYIRNAVVAAAMARAWYEEADKERLAAFGRVISTGFADGDQDSAAVALRNYFITTNGKVRAAGWREAFLRAMNAVHYFMRGKKLHVIKALKDEVYPLPASMRPAPAPKGKGKK